MIGGSPKQRFDRLTILVEVLDPVRKPIGFSVAPTSSQMPLILCSNNPTRKSEKPFHFDNLTAFILGNYDTRISNGLEADDLMCIEQYSRLKNDDTIICTRDKDLRQCPGWQFGWECGKQASFGPTLVDNKGLLNLSNGELKGTGTKFFFGQMLIGDTVDNIPGCPKVGPVKAFDILDKCVTKRDHELAVINAYKKVYPTNYKEMIEEQSKLLWMIRELNQDGSPVHYEWKFDD